MVLHWRPTGPLPPATYWRRRGVLGGLLVVLLLTAYACSGGGGAKRPAGRPQARPSATHTPAPSASPTPPVGAAGACADADLVVSPTTDSSTYAIGATPVLTVTIRNRGSAACTRALGRGAVELIVTSGSDRIWSSQDCSPNDPQEVQTLQPGGQVTLHVTWSGHRSTPGCGGPHAAAAPGTYVLTARVGTLRQAGAVFHVA